MGKIEIKNCMNCAHKKGRNCILSGLMWDTTRTYNMGCDINFSGWQPRQKRKGLKQWLMSLWDNK
jgi:hypothetical protein